MGKDFIVKTSSFQANRLLMGGFHSSEIQTIYSSSGSGIQTLLLTAVMDAAAKGLKTIYFDFMKNISFEAIKANDLDLENGSISLVRRRPFHSVNTTINYVTNESEKIEADFVVMDFSQPARTKILDRAWGQSNNLGTYSKMLAQMASYKHWAMVVVLPVTSLHWRPYGTLSAGRGGLDVLTLSRGNTTISVPYLRKNGIPFAVNVSDELARAFIANPKFCQEVHDRKHSCTNEVPENIREGIRKDAFHLYELTNVLNDDEELFREMKGLLAADAESVLANGMTGKLGVPPGREFDVIGKVKRILSFDGEIGDFDGMDTDSASAVIDIWARTLERTGISIDFVHADDQAAMNVGRALGLDSAAAAAFAGVPLDDILGE